MRWGLLVLTVSLAITVSADPVKKFPYIAGFTDVQVISVDHRGIQIMHSNGMCYLNPEELGEADAKKLEEELKLLEVRKAEYKILLAAQKKQMAAEAKKAKTDLAAQTKVQMNEINALIKEFQTPKAAPKGAKGKKGAVPTVYDILRTLEKKFGVENNRNMGLRGRCRAIEGHIIRNYPLAKNRSNLIKLITTKRNEIETKLRAEAAKRKAEAAAKAKAAEKKKK